MISLELEATGLMSLEIGSKIADVAVSLQIGDTKVSSDGVISLDIGKTGCYVYHLPNNSGKMLYL